MAIIEGTSGDDTLSGGPGPDELRGGLGNDRYFVAETSDLVIEAAAAGNDRVFASVNYTLAAGQHIETLSTTNNAGTVALNLTGNELANVILGNAGNNKLVGAAGNDKLLGGDGNDTLDGGTGNDGLYGQAGNDTLKGSSGNDRLDGGLGRDYLYGGSGRDVFDFNSIEETAVGSLRDIIYDFQRGQDDIDLSSIDASTRSSGNQAFSWIGAVLVGVSSHSSMIGPRASSPSDSMRAKSWPAPRPPGD